MTEGDVVLFEDEVGKLRPAVIVRVLGDRAVLVGGTRTCRADWAHVVVERDTSAAKALRLVATTYFYARTVAVVTQARVRPLHVRCPPELFQKLCRLIGIVAP